MKTSQQWFEYFSVNLQKERVDWNQAPSINKTELKTILPSLQAWQLGETSEGKNLLNASGRYARQIADDWYVSAVELFIKEEQKHGNNLGRYLDLAGKPRIGKNWGDTLFRKIRYFNASMELWTLAVITVESTAQIFYQSLKDATGCHLLKQICTDILIDEAAHIHFQMERMTLIYEGKSEKWKFMAFYGYAFFYYVTAFVVWIAHRKIFKAGGNSFQKFFRKMTYKYSRTLQRLKTEKHEIRNDVRCEM